MDALSRKLLSIPQGGVVEVTEVPLRDLPQIPYEKTAGGPPFLFSDQPEYIAVAEGAVLRERVEPGVVRLYAYHCNGVEGLERKITWVLENLGEHPLHYRFVRRGFAGPNGDYAAVAKTALRQFLHSTPEHEKHTVAIGDAVAIEPGAENARVHFNELIHGFYEIEIDQPARVTVLQTDPETPGGEAARRIAMTDVVPPRSPSGAGRGLYRTSDYRVSPPPGFVLDTRGGPRQLIVADGTLDPWIVGTDSSTGKPSTLEGNYGVRYSIGIPYVTRDGRGWAVLTWNARSRDRWCENMVNVIGVNAGRYPGGFVDIPGDRVALTGELDVSLIQVFPPLTRGTQGTIALTYSPPGASCLPTPILFIPLKMK